MQNFYFKQIILNSFKLNVKNKVHNYINVNWPLHAKSILTADAIKPSILHFITTLINIFPSKYPVKCSIPNKLNEILENNFMKNMQKHDFK